MNIPAKYSIPSFELNSVSSITNQRWRWIGRPPFSKRAATQQIAFSSMENHLRNITKYRNSIAFDAYCTETPQTRPQTDFLPRNIFLFFRFFPSTRLSLSKVKLSVKGLAASCDAINAMTRWTRRFYPKGWAFPKLVCENLNEKYNFFSHQNKIKHVSRLRSARSSTQSLIQMISSLLFVYFFEFYLNLNRWNGLFWLRQRYHPFLIIRRRWRNVSFCKMGSLPKRLFTLPKTTWTLNSYERLWSTLVQFVKWDRRLVSVSVLAPNFFRLIHSSRHRPTCLPCCCYCTRSRSFLYENEVFILFDPMIEDEEGTNIFSLKNKLVL